MLNVAQQPHFAHGVGSLISAHRLARHHLDHVRCAAARVLAELHWTEGALAHHSDGAQRPTIDLVVRTEVGEVFELPQALAHCRRQHLCESLGAEAQRHTRADSGHGSGDRLGA
eukprot:scaffold52428_cov57-Phaeocystis_antarctica.AAC.3